MVNVPLGSLFPAGGPADPAYMIGRRHDVADVASRLRAGQHVLVAGDRRIGKTTVCQAVCAELRDGGFVVVRIDVPEAADSTGLCRDVVRAHLSAGEGLKRGARTAITKTAQRILEQAGVPANLTALAPGQLPEARRQILELPRRMAEAGDRVVFWLDELQRVADYEDGEHVLRDLSDIYAGQEAAVVLVDGSEARTFQTLLGSSDGLGKLVYRHDLSPVIPSADWRAGLPQRFEEAEHPIDGEALERLIEFGAEQPYRTMVVAREAALTAVRLGGDTGTFEVADAIAAANKRLRDDGR